MDYAVVGWYAEDIKKIKPEWTLKQCDDFLESIADKLEDWMVEQGWFFIEEVINERSQ